MGMRLIGGIRTTGSSHTHDMNTPIDALYIHVPVLEYTDPLLPTLPAPAGEGYWFEKESDPAAPPIVAVSWHVGTVD